MKTRETNKKAYINNYTKVFNKEMADTIWTEEGQEIWIEEYAYCGWRERREDIKDKADALFYGIIDARKYCNKIKEEIRKVK